MASLASTQNVVLGSSGSPLLIVGWHGRHKEGSRDAARSSAHQLFAAPAKKDKQKNEADRLASKNATDTVLKFRYGHLPSARSIDPTTRATLLVPVHARRSFIIYLDD
jgi:hypothetical protein